MTKVGTIPRIVFLALAVPMAAPAQVAVPDAANATQSIGVKSVGALHVVFREHPGSYWTIAPTVDLVREHMDRLGEPGPLFVRYIQPPGADGGQPFRIEVGYVTDQQRDVTHPFQYAQRVAEEVAFMRVPPALASPSRALPRLRAWALERGYSMRSTLTEIHPLSARGASARATVEVQLVVSEPHATPDTTLKDAGDAPKTPGPAVSAEAPEFATPDVPTPNSDAQDSGLLATLPPTAEKGAERATSGNPPAQPEPVVSQSTNIAELAGKGRYMRVAELVVPIGQELSPAESLWLGQILFRVGAAARGLDRYYPDRTEEVAKLAEALDRRYRQSESYARHNPLEQAVSVAEPHSDPDAKRRRAITRDLDRLLGRIAWQAGTAEDVQVALIEILVRVKNELAIDQNVAPPDQR